MTTAVHVDTISKAFKQGDDSLPIFSDFSLQVEEQQVAAIVGPSGSGKSTLLNLMSGLLSPDAGHIRICDNLVRSFGYMMQDHLLLPWRTLMENALLGTEIRGHEIDRAKPLISSYFDSFALGDYGGTYPSTASGGMRQRVALIRTLALEPQLILLDEPFANLDFDIKVNIQKVLLGYIQRRKATVVLVTHDIDDAIALADIIVVLSEQPTRVKAEIVVNLGLGTKDPIKARASPRFSQHFSEVCAQLRYLS